VRKWSFNAVVALIALAAFMLVAGGRVLHNHHSEASHAISRATVADHSANFDSPLFVIVAHSPITTIMPVCAYVYFPDIQAQPFIHVYRNSIRPPPVGLA
jgi:hypothetical protein